MKKLITVKTFLVLFFGSLLFSSCSFQVVYPKPVDPSENTSGPPINAAGQLVITIQFTDPVNLGSLVMGKTVLLSFPGNPSVAANLSLSIDLKTLTITTKDIASNLLHLSPDGGFTLQLVGTDRGNGVITTTSNTVLDGDYDGKPGGNYVKQYHIIG